VAGGHKRIIVICSKRLLAAFHRPMFPSEPSEEAAIGRAPWLTLVKNVRAWSNLNAQVKVSGSVQELKHSLISYFHRPVIPSMSSEGACEITLDVSELVSDGDSGRDGDDDSGLDSF
jgi:hypothetical protein